MTARRPLVYIAGPYSTDPVTHTRTAVETGLSLWDTGLIIPHIPHLTMVADLIRPRPHGYWCDLDLAHLEHCDAVLRVDGHSPGADREATRAVALGIPVFSDRVELFTWAKRWANPPLPPAGPIAEFRKATGPEGQDPEHYLQVALGAITKLGWLARPPITNFTVLNPNHRALRPILDALYGANGQGLNPDAYPPVVLWCLRLNGNLHHVAGLDIQLHDWRTAAEDAAGERFHWLPSFPEHTP